MEGPSTSGRSPFWDSLRSTPVVFRELLAGGVAGITGKSSVAPLERCKILFQTGRMTPGNLKTTLATIYQNEGVAGLFRGNGASVLRIIPYSTIHFTMYEQYRRLLVEHVAGTATPVHPVWDLAAGSAAGATAVLITYPLDLVRTRLAFTSEIGGGPPVPKYLDPARHSQHLAGGQPSRVPVGAAGLESPRAPPAPRGRSVSRGGSLAQSAPGSRAFAAAATARGVAPRDGIFGTLAKTLRHEGVRGAYHGVGASMYGILPYAGLKFYVYQSLKQWYHHGARARAGAGMPSTKPSESEHGTPPHLPVPVMLSFGGVAGLVAQTVTYPFDVVRRRMQVEALQLESMHASMEGGLTLRSTPQALLLIAREQGWRVLFSGLSINYLKVVPSTAIGFTMYDYMKSRLALTSNL